MEPTTNEIKNRVHDAIKSGEDFVEKAAEKVKDKAAEFAPNPNGVMARQSGEGCMTKKIESMTSKIPSATFLSLALGSIGLAAMLHSAGKKADAQFVGQWVPTILILGLYNKLVKLEGSE